MHRYYTCLEGKYPGQVTAIAILTDGNNNFRPEPFREIRGPKKVHQLCYDYAVYKVLDQSEEELEQSDNPFALVLRSEEHTSELQSLMRISYAVFCLKNKR